MTEDGEGPGPPGEDPEGRASVVLAEDDPDVRGLLAACLREEGFRVLEAEDGTSFLRILRGGPSQRGGASEPAVVVADVRMPGASGLDVLEELRRRDPLTPVIVMTAFGDAETRGRALRLGVSAMLDKPFPPQDLAVAVHRLARWENRLDAWLMDLETGVGD